MIISLINEAQILASKQNNIFLSNEKQKKEKEKYYVYNIFYNKFLRTRQAISDGQKIISVVNSN